MINKQELEARMKNMTEEEKKIAFNILEQLGDNGKSDLYNSLLYQDYKEIPVDIETFLTDDKYLGNAWKDVEGNSKVYPFWMDILKEIFPNNLDTAYTTLLETGARGEGKSEIACGCVISYLLYRVMCLKNPLEYYHLKPTEKICFAFMNIKKELTEKIANDKFQKTIQLSPWFREKGTISQRNGLPYWTPNGPIEFIIGSQADDVIGLPIFAAFFDEISFIRNQDIDKQKQKAKDMIDTALGGMMTRFIHNGKNPTMLIVASSKRSEQSFMEQYIKLLAETNKTNTLVVDKPIWEVKPKGTYSDKTFYIGVGNKFLDNIVIPRNDYDNLNKYKEKGYQIIAAPIDFEAKANEDLERMLCDIAGISSVSSNKYLSAQRIISCINPSYKNPFPDIIETGNDFKDTNEYKDFFDMNNIPKELKSKPLFIHLDMSVSGDMTGIAGVWIVKKLMGQNQQNKDLFFRLAFSTSIKAPKGRQISFAKNRNFIRWLKQQGFIIKKITFDTFQSYDTGQQLKAEGFDCEILSVDRLDSDHVNKPYQYFKSSLYENRFEMYKSDRLFDEMVQIERDLATGKVDHPTNGHKDALDAVVGATFTASKFGDQYAFDYGEVYDTIMNDRELNEKEKDEEIKKQMTIDLQKQLDQVFNPFKQSQQNKDDDEDSIIFDGNSIVF